MFDEANGIEYKRDLYTTSKVTLQVYGMIRFFFYNFDIHVFLSVDLICFYSTSFCLPMTFVIEISSSYFFFFLPFFLSSVHRVFYYIFFTVIVVSFYITTNTVCAVVNEKNKEKNRLKLFSY